MNRRLDVVNRAPAERDRPSDDMNKCYGCRHRRPVPYSYHSSCAHPTVMQSGGSGEALNIAVDKRGVDGGWCDFPYNFDPIWIVRCDADVAPAERQPKLMNVVEALAEALRETGAK